jgi:hypothetical protein
MVTPSTENSCNLVVLGSACGESTFEDKEIRAGIKDGSRARDDKAVILAWPALRANLFDANVQELKECLFPINTTAISTQRFTLMKPLIYNLAE